MGLPHSRTAPQYIPDMGCFERSRRNLMQMYVVLRYFHAHNGDYSEIKSVSTSRSVSGVT